MTEWHETDEALALLARFDAAERSADRYAGMRFDGPAKAFRDECVEIEGALDALRYKAVEEIANAAGVTWSDEWESAWIEADDHLLTVEQACANARKAGLGDGLLEQAA